MTNTGGVRDFWLLHIKVGEHQRDMALAAWNSNAVGLWHGPFTAEDLIQSASPQELDRVPHQASFLEARGLTTKTNRTKWAFEFARLPDNAWIVLRLDGKTFGIAQLGSAIQSTPIHPLNHLKPDDPKREVYKFRRIVPSTKREIRLSLEERAPLMRTLKSYDTLRRFSTPEEIALLNRLLDKGMR